MCFPVTVHDVSSYDVTGARRQVETNEMIHKAENGNRRPDEPTTDDQSEDERTVYLIEFESESNEKEDSLQNKGKDGHAGKQQFVLHRRMPRIKQLSEAEKMGMKCL